MGTEPQAPLTLPCALHPADSLMLTRSPMVAQAHVIATQEGQMSSLFLGREELLRAHCWIGAALNAHRAGPDFVGDASYLIRTSKPDDSIVAAVAGAGGEVVVRTRSTRPRDLLRLAAALAEDAAEQMQAGLTKDTPDDGVRQIGLARGVAAVLRRGLGDE